MKLGDLIKKRREQLNLTQEELADLLNYKSKSTINKIEKNINDIPFAKLEDFAKVLKVDLAYLLGWDIESTKQKPQSNITHFTNDLISMPLFSSISAGYGAIIDNCFIDNEEIEYIPMIQFPNWQYCFAVRVKGDSMSPKISDGDIVVINTQFSIENNQIGAFMIDDEAFLKRKKISNDNTLLLVSNNDNYAPIVVTKDKNFKEIGKLTQIISNNVD
jgi:SOS-response transcriptional repressor, lexA